MTHPDQKHFDPGFINSVTHSLTGSQVLFYLMHTWASDPSLPVIIWCNRSDAAYKANSIRTALSKERRSRNTPRTFELRFSEPWPHTHMGIKGEAIKVERVGGTILTRMQAALQQLRRTP